jgi:hypothetical protein
MILIAYFNETNFISLTNEMAIFLILLANLITLIVNWFFDDNIVDEMKNSKNSYKKK